MDLQMIAVHCSQPERDHVRYLKALEINFLCLISFSLSLQLSLPTFISNVR